jgi:Putative adhesin
MQVIRDRPRFDHDAPQRWGRAPAVRTAWKVLAGLFAAVMLAWGTSQVVTVLAHQEETFVEEFAAGDVTLVDVHNSAGSVVVRGSDRADDTIRVTTRVDHGLRRTGHSERIEGDRLVLDTSCPLFLTTFCEVRYTIDVPREIDLSVRGSGGSITVTDVTGDVDLDSDAGGVDVERVGGDRLRMDSDAGSVSAADVRSTDVEATSDAGSVTVRFAGDPRTVRADSDAGGVELVLPPDGGPYRVEADSSAGGVETSVNTSRTSDRRITATSDAGSVTVRYGG